MAPFLRSGFEDFLSPSNYRFEGGHLNALHPATTRSLEGTGVSFSSNVSPSGCLTGNAPRKSKPQQDPSWEI